MPVTFSFTYSTVTPESVESGDFEDNGFIGYPYIFRYSMNVDEIRQDIIKNPQDYREQWEVGELKYILNYAENLGIRGDLDSCDWFASGYSAESYTTGEDIEYCLHIDGVTPSTYRRISRFLSGKNILTGEARKR